MFFCVLNRTRLFCGELFDILCLLIELLAPFLCRRRIERLLCLQSSGLDIEKRGIVFLLGLEAFGGVLRVELALLFNVPPDNRQFCLGLLLGDLDNRLRVLSLGNNPGLGKQVQAERCPVHFRFVLVAQRLEVCAKLKHSLLVLAECARCSIPGGSTITRQPLQYIAEIFGRVVCDCSCLSKRGDSALKPPLNGFKCPGQVTAGCLRECLEKRRQAAAEQFVNRHANRL